MKNQQLYVYVGGTSSTIDGGYNGGGNTEKYANWGQGYGGGGATDVRLISGEWNNFELDGAGCERGVYAGKFFYDNILINSRTYDKGETFRIVTVQDQ